MRWLHALFRKGMSGAADLFRRLPRPGKPMGFPVVKERMKRFGKVDIPAEAFTVMLKRD